MARSNEPGFIKNLKRDGKLISEDRKLKVAAAIRVIECFWNYCEISSHKTEKQLEGAYIAWKRGHATNG